MASRADVSFLRSVSLFQDLDDADLQAVLPRLRERRLRRGEVLFREGDPGNEMYLIRSGQVVISKHVKGRVDQVLASMGPGEFFGEMSLIDRQPRSATIQADRDSLLLSLDPDSLERLMETNPRASTAIFYRMLQVFIKRLRESGDLVAEVTRWGLEATGLDVEHT